MLAVTGLATLAGCASTTAATRAQPHALAARMVTGSIIPQTQPSPTLHVYGNGPLRNFGETTPAQGLQLLDPAITIESH
ncbi:MAG TPA: hypothetical protein VMD56_08900 [Steroidobacteraceae bacterium]|nr:hypothetical protein [Steroidobacteraceae bacterium]